MEDVITVSAPYRLEAPRTLKRIETAYRCRYDRGSCGLEAPRTLKRIETSHNPCTRLNVDPRLEAPRTLKRIETAVNQVIQ